MTKQGFPTTMSIPRVHLPEQHSWLEGGSKLRLMFQFWFSMLWLMLRLRWHLNLSNLTGMQPMLASALLSFLATPPVSWYQIWLNFNMVGPFFISCDFLPKTNPTPGLEPEYVTLAEHLKSEGYTNHLVGKWHLGQSKVGPWTFIPLFAQVLLIIPGFLFNLFLCRRSTTRWEEALTHSTASLARVSTTGQNNKEAGGKVSKYVKLVFLRFDWWRLFYSVLLFYCGVENRCFIAAFIDKTRFPQVRLVARLGSWLREQNPLDGFA